MGGYFLALNLATFFANIARFGMENTLLRFVSEALGVGDGARVRRVIHAGGILFLLIAGTAGMLFPFAGRFLATEVFASEALANVIPWVSLWMVLLAFQFFVAETFRGFQAIGMSVVFGGLLTSAVSVFLLAFMMFGAMDTGLGDVLTLIAVAAGLNALLAGGLLQKRLLRYPPVERWKQEARDILEHSWPLLIHNLTLFVVLQSDLWLLGAYRPDEEVAIYGAAARVVILIGVALVIINSVVPPLISRLNVNNERRRMERILRTTATLAFIPALSALIVFVFFGSSILGVVFGEYYREGGTILTTLGMGQAVSVFVGSCGYTLIMTGHRQSVMRISVLSAVAALLLGFLAVRSYGAIGVAVAFSATTVCGQMATLFITKIRCGVWTHAGAGPLLDLLRNNGVFRYPA